MQHIQINKRLQYQTLAQSRGSESLASQAWRNISGIADRARWRSGVVFVTFPCLFPLHIVTTASHSSECAQICGESLGRCSTWWCPPTLAQFGAARRAIARRSRPIRETAPCDQGLTPCLLHLCAFAVLTRRLWCRFGRCHAGDRAWIAISLSVVILSTWRRPAPLLQGTVEAGSCECAPSDDCGLVPEEPRKASLNRGHHAKLTVGKPWWYQLRDRTKHLVTMHQSCRSNVLRMSLWSLGHAPAIVSSESPDRQARGDPYSSEATEDSHLEPTKIQNQNKMRITSENGKTRIPTYRSGCKNSERILGDDRVPEHRDSHASSSHELSLEPTRSVDLGKHSVYTHFPKDRNCEICQRTKITRAPCRRRNGRVVPRAEKMLVI